jgi:hypothetical protein
MDSYEYLYIYGQYAIYILYALSLFKVWDEAPSYLNAIHYFFQIFIGLLLVLFNNPFIRHRYRPIDRKIAFSAGFFLLASTSLNAFIYRIRDPLQKQSL